MEQLSAQATAILLISLRIVPTLAFAPPFTLVRVPGMVRMLLGLSLAAWLVAAYPAQTWQISGAGGGTGGLLGTAAAELFLGVSLALALQLAFAALLTAGRTIDIQAGFGLAALVDPTTRAQLPLAGTLLSYAAALLFFTSDGPADLLAIWAVSVAEVPIGGVGLGDNLDVLLSYIAVVFGMAFGAAGLMMIVLFLVDLSIAFMSRTLPQMNVMLMGFQVKTLVFLLLLPISISLSLALLLRIMRVALETTARMA